MAAILVDVINVLSHAFNHCVGGQSAHSRPSHSVCSSSDKGWWFKVLGYDEKPSAALPGSACSHISKALYNVSVVDLHQFSRICWGSWLACADYSASFYCVFCPSKDSIISLTQAFNCGQLLWRTADSMADLFNKHIKKATSRTKEKVSVQ